MFLTVDVPFPGATGTALRGINTVGQIIGHYADSSGEQHNFLYNYGIFTPFDFPGAFPGSFGTFASDINDHGQIVGSYADNDLVEHGFLFDGKKFITIDVPGFVGTEVIGINNRGQIVGRYLETNLEKSHGFIATPKNEPKSKSRLLVSERDD